ncbi:MAG: manno-octulosonate cytidylyltransferase [Pseudomonadota bacterium]
MSVVVAIPARYESSRYPGKPLVALRGASGTPKTLVQRTYEAAAAARGIDRVIVATDDERIASHCRGFGAEVMMTSPSCRNGTERCAEVLANLTDHPDLVVNVQGDAPLTPPHFIEALVDGCGDCDVATPVLRCDLIMLERFRADRRNGQVGGTLAVTDRRQRALYFSKEIIPFADAIDTEEAAREIFHHVGLYAYRPRALGQYLSWAEGILETREGLEQLRFLEHGASIACVEVDGRGRSFWELNNPVDVPRIESALAAMGIE